MTLPLFQKIILAFDGSASSKDACEFATVLAKGFNSNVTVAYVLPPITILSGRMKGVYESEVQNKARDQILKIQSQMNRQGVDARIKVLRAGDSIARAIVDFSEGEQADLIVVGTRGFGGLKRMVLGSVSNGLLNEASCPVIVVRGGTSGLGQKLQKILVATDGSKNANRAVQTAVSIAKNVGAGITIVHAIYMSPSAYGTFTPMMDQILEGLRSEGERIISEATKIAEENGVKAGSQLIDNDQNPVSAITSYSKEGRFGLIVMGTRGLSGVRKAFLGSVANGVVHSANCSVLVTK